jgi:tripartite-type tricarboxylate transporter receptor subunit TctC
MQMIRRGGRRLGTAAALAVVSLVAAGCGGGDEEVTTGAGGPATPSAEAAADGDCETFYDGKTLKIVVPYKPGGGFDAYARALAPVLEEQLDGAKVTVENLPGAGGLIGANAVFKAKSDGTTIGLINYPGAVFAEQTGKEGADIKNDEWTFLGRVAAVNPVVYTSAKSGIETADDLVSAKEKVVFGIGGVGSDAFYATRVLGETLGFPYEIIAGYPGSGEADAALLAGEVEASVNSIDSAVQTIEGGKANPVLFVGTEPSEQLPDVPTVTSVGDAQQKETLESLAAIYDLERVLVAPPGVPEERADCLGEAINAALTDQGLVDELTKAERTLNPLTREETIELVEQASEGLAELSPLLGDS